MTNETRAAKREHWKGVLDRWRESGLSKAAFCRENGIRPWQFQYWFRRLNEAGPDPAAAFASVHCGGGYERENGQRRGKGIQTWGSIPRGPVEIEPLFGAFLASPAPATAPGL